MLKRLYDWTLAKAAHRHAERWLILFSFLESSIFPIPPHPLLGLMCLARPERAVRYGVVCTIASVAGALLGYAVGHFLFATVGTTLLDLLHLKASFPRAACMLRDNAALIIIGKGATPIPFKLVTISAGFIGVPIFTLIWASFLSRGLQFVLVGVLFWKFGAPIKVFLERYLALISIGFVVLVVGGVLAAGMLTGHGTDDKCSKATMETITAS